MLSAILLDRLNSNVTFENGHLNVNDVYKTEFNVTSYSTAEFNKTLNSTLEYEETVLAEEEGFFVKNIKLIKAIVLCVVIMIMIISTCRFVFKSFSRYLDGERKDDV